MSRELRNDRSDRSGRYGRRWPTSPPPKSVDEQGSPVLARSAGAASTGPLLHRFVRQGEAMIVVTNALALSACKGTPCPRDGEVGRRIYRERSRFPNRPTERLQAPRLFGLFVSLRGGTGSRGGFGENPPGSSLGVPVFRNSRSPIWIPPGTRHGGARGSVEEGNPETGQKPAPRGSFTRPPRPMSSSSACSSRIGQRRLRFERVRLALRAPHGTGRRCTARREARNRAKR